MEIAYDYKQERTLTLAFVLVAFVAIALGGFIGLLQALEHAAKSIPGLEAVPLYPIPVVGWTYYRGLTLHGVLNALTWTTFFISGFLMLVLSRALRRSMAVIWLSWLAFVVMLVGVSMAGWAMLTGNATVLYTFYVPMKAHPLHYIGLTLIVVGTWLHSLNHFLTYRAWRRENPGVRTPLAVVGALTTWIVWDIATIGVAAEMFITVLPWSLGIIPDTNPLLARTLFWYFGHPLVYFWLLPAYVAWYTFLPRVAGGKLFSDPLARLVFVLFILFSTPVGFHHQALDPGVSAGWKLLHTFLTFAILFPSFITAFTVTASMEVAGRMRGATGLVDWIGKLPWRDPLFASVALSMILFAVGGIGGAINASFGMNAMVHNTAFIQG